MIRVSSGVIHAWLCLFFLALQLTGLPSEPMQNVLVQISPANVSDKDRSTINRSTHSVWYDANDGTIRPIQGNKAIDVNDRHDSIAGNTRASTPGWWKDFLQSWRDFFSLLFQSWQILLIVCSLGILSIVGFLFFRYGLGFQASNSRRTRLSDKKREEVKMQELPFEVEQSMFGLLAQAERHRAMGDFSKAVIYLFSHALIEMDNSRCIRLERGKTNRAYLRELRDHDNLAGFIKELVSAFEYAFFGKHVLSQDAFERIWLQVPAFDAYLKQIVSNPSPSRSIKSAKVA